ncbi:MAG TPA: FxsA family protein [Firmicutes bacterium]|nr:FxsA family protein [Candidatus Fermentithermobacillaceae bacterium]
MRSRWTVVGVVLVMVVPVLELALLIEVGKRIGTWWTLAIVVGTGVLGGTLLAAEGYGVFRKAKKEVNEGRIPKNQIIDGLLVVIGAVLLVTPGLITDTVGLILLFPLTRLPVRSAVKRWIQQYIYIDI